MFPIYKNEEEIKELKKKKIKFSIQYKFVNNKGITMYCISFSGVLS